jgi:hypothetical protein
MAKRHGTAPRLDVRVTEQQWDRATQAASGACLIADAIKQQYPALSQVEVDVATIRATDKERGERYVWLTPGSAQALLLAFDQGWKQSTDHIVIRDAVQVTPLKTAGAKQRATRAQRRTQLEDKEASGATMTRREAQSLTTMRATDERHAANRTTHTRGPVTGVIDQRGGPATKIGGDAIPTGRKHPNLLAGRNRHFGAKQAQPSAVFEEAVEQRVREQLAQQADETTGGATLPDRPAR